MVVFAWFAHPQRAWAIGAAGAGLAAACLAVAAAKGSLVELLGVRWPVHTRGSRPTSGCHIPAVVICTLLFGTVLAVCYRWYLGPDILPNYLTAAGAMCGLIGAAEELAYRGFVQGAWRRYGQLVAVLFAAGAHTSYKVTLLASTGGAAVNLWALAAATLGVGIVFGWMRDRFGVLAPLLAHVAFDLVVYGDHATLPWWVVG
jgi:hypothetical protein